MNKMTRFLLASLLITSSATVSAVEIIGNETRVELTSAPTLIDVLGLSVQPVGTGSLEAVGPTAVFPVTGGTIDDVTSEALIEHEGSGLTLSLGTDSLMLLNFLIDTAQSTIFGDAVIIDDVGGVIGASVANDAPLFSLDGLDLLLTGTASGVLDGLFGFGDLTGFKIGEASLDLNTAAPVPVPAAVWLFGSAIGLLAVRKRQASEI